MSSYAGARGRVTLERLASLGRSWAVQPKVDGMYCRAYLDSRGRIARLFSRSEREVPRSLAGDLLGALVGRPHAELVGELEAHTEAGNRAAACRGGQRLLHLFDCLHDGTRSLVREPYRVRRDALYRMQSEVVNYGPELPWLRDERGMAHEKASGRFCEARLEGWRLTPIVAQQSARQAEILWGEHVEQGGGEGLVAVNLEAQVGRRGAKLKCKPVDTLDATVVHVSDRQAVCDWRGQVFAVGLGRHQLEVGDVVEVKHSGWYETAILPRFASVLRKRVDLC